MHKEEMENEKVYENRKNRSLLLGVLFILKSITILPVNF